MKSSQIRKLSILSRNVGRCNKCKRLRPNGMAVPWWHPTAEYLALAEAPGEEEVGSSPLVGTAGKFWAKENNRVGLKRQNFIIINTVQCRPVENGRNGKPTYNEIENCRFWVERYIEVAKPKKIIAFGNYALYYLFKMTSGITKECGKVHIYKEIPVYPCVHPAYVLRNPESIEKYRSVLHAFIKN